MTTKILLHCGAPKTGSTSFQHLLYANLDRLQAAGFYCPAVSRKKRVKDDIRILLGEILRPENRNPGFIRHIRQVLKDIEAESGAHTLIISNEGLLGKPFAPRYPEFYERAEDSARRIADALEDYDVEARFVIRDFSGFFPSWYVQQVRMGSRMTFEEFLGAYDFGSVTWRRPVEALRKHFGPERVGIYDHGELVRDAHRFLSHMFPEVMAALGEKGRELPNKNVSIGRGMVEVYRRWNVIAEKLARGPSSRKTIQHIGRRYFLLPFERFSRSEKLRLPEDMAAVMKARFKADLVAVAPRSIFDDPAAPVAAHAAS